MKMGDKFGGKVSIALWITIMCLIVAIAFQSRSFILGYSVSIIFILFIRSNTEINGKRASIAGVLLIVLLLVLTLCFKTGSSSGRMLIYKISRYLWFQTSK